jgi:hypothetical protein
MSFFRSDLSKGKESRMAMRGDFEESINVEIVKVIDLLRGNAKAYAREFANEDPTTEAKVFHQTLNWFIMMLFAKALNKELQA